METKKLETIRYKTNFLKNVIFRIDFSPIVRLKKELSPDFQDVLRPNFPLFEEQTAVEYFTTIKEDRKIDETRTSYVWNFFTHEKTQKVTVSYQHLAVEFFKYHHFNEFNQIVEQVYTSFSHFYKPLDVKRLGLRYINNIVIDEGHPLEWAEFINPHLIHPLDNFIADKTHLSRFMSQTVLNRGDHTIIFSYGIYNSEFPARISRKEYILDYDCFTSDFDDNDVMSKLIEYNVEILELFEESITEALRAKMGGKI